MKYRLVSSYVKKIMVQRIAGIDKYVTSKNFFQNGAPASVLNMTLC